MSNMKSFIGVVSALLFFGRNFASFFMFLVLQALHKYASDTHTHASSSSSSLSLFPCFVPFHSRSIARQFATKQFFKCGKKNNIILSNARLRFDYVSRLSIRFFFLRLSHSLLFLHLWSRRTISAALHTTDLIAIERTFKTIMIFFSLFIIQNKTTKKKKKKMPLLLIFKNFEYFSFICVHKCLGHWVSGVVLACQPAKRDRESRE